MRERPGMMDETTEKAREAIDETNETTDGANETMPAAAITQAAITRRRNTFLRTLLAILAVGAAYYAFYHVTGFGLPCLIRLVTGYLCPGCGMTRAMVALLSGDPAEAFRQNTLSLTVIPILALYGVWKGCQWVRHGDCDYRIWEMVLLVALTIVSLAYGITRNIPH